MSLPAHPETMKMFHVGTRRAVSFSGFYRNHGIPHLWFIIFGEEYRSHESVVMSLPAHPEMNENVSCRDTACRVLQWFLPKPWNNVALVHYFRSRIKN